MGLLTLIETQRPIHNKWIDVLRILTGFMIHLHGLLFVYNTGYVMKLMQVFTTRKDLIILIQAMAIAQLTFGSLIMLGLGTRSCSLLMLPLIIFSLYIAPFSKSFTGILEGILSIVLAGLMIFYMIKGSGRFSVSYYLGKKPDEG